MGESPSESAWEVTAARYVAYFDIMGFKDMVLRISHNEIYEMMKKIGIRIKLHKSIQWQGLPKELIKTTSYSDSIIIYSKDNSDDSKYALFATVAGLTNDLLSEAIPHKGAVAFGMMTLDSDNSIFFGQPLIDAYLLQEELNFYGVVVHATAEQEVEKSKGGLVPFYASYDCQFKKGHSTHMVIAPGFVVASTPEYQPYCDKLFASFKQLRFKTSGHLRTYIDNTELYLTTIKNKFKIT